MSLGVSLVLNEIAEKLLYTVKEVDGKKMVVDRELPFRLRYRLNRNYDVLSKDAKYFDMQRMMLMAKYGTPTEDGKNVVIAEDRQNEYKEKISELIDSTVEHTIMTLEPDDIMLINDADITVSPDAMTVFIGYMTNDPAFAEEISTEVKLVKHEDTKVESADKSEDTAKETKTKKTTKSKSSSKKATKAKESKTEE